MPPRSVSRSPPPSHAETTHIERQKAVALQVRRQQINNLPGTQADEVEWTAGSACKNPALAEVASHGSPATEKDRIAPMSDSRLAGGTEKYMSWHATIGSSMVIPYNIAGPDEVQGACGGPTRPQLRPERHKRSPTIFRLQRSTVREYPALDVEYRSKSRHEY